MWRSLTLPTRKIKYLPRRGSTSLGTILTCFARSPELFGWSQKRGSAPRDEFRDFVTHSTENSVRVIPTI